MSLPLQNTSLFKDQSMISHPPSPPLIANSLPVLNDEEESPSHRARREKASLKRDILHTLREKSEMFDGFKFQVANNLRKVDNDLSYLSEMNFEDNLRLSSQLNNRGGGQGDDRSDRSAPHQRQSDDQQ